MRWIVVLVAFAAALSLGLWMALRSDGERRSPRELERAAEAPAAPAPSFDPLDVRREERSGVPDPAASAPTGGAAEASPADLIVRFLDARGEPVAKLSIQLVTELAQANDAGDRTLHHSMWTAQGDLPRHGIRVTAAKLEDALAKARVAQAEQRAVSVRLQPAFTAPQCSSFVFEALEKPATDVELRLEGSGLLRIEAFAPGGKPFEGRLAFDLRVPSEQAELAKLESYRSALGCSGYLRAEDPRIRVPLAKRLFAELNATDGVHLPQRVETFSPLAEGEEVILRVDLRAAPVLKGRLLSSEGEPLRNQRFSWSMQVSSGTTLSAGKTDAEAIFRIPMFIEPTPRLIEELKLTPTPADRENLSSAEIERFDRIVLADVEVPSEGARDLGDVRLEKSGMQLIASGAVFDAAGAPIAGAQINAWSIWPPADTGPWAESALLDDAWTSTDAKGEFRIYSKKPCRALRLNATKKGYYLERGVNAAPGSTGVRLVLRTGGTIEGSVLLSEGVKPDEIDVYHSPERGNGETAKLDRDGRFRFGGCKPGPHRLDFRVRPWPVLHVIENLVVAGEEVLADPRLCEIDLRARLLVLRVRVLDPSGEPQPRQIVNIAAPGDSKSSHQTGADTDGRVAFLLPAELPEVELSILNGLPSLVRWAPDEQEVRLTAPITLELTLGEAVELPRGVQLALRLSLELDASASERAAPSSSHARGFREGRSTCRVPSPGRYVLTWSVHTTGSDSKDADLEEVSRSSIEVAPATSSQPFRVVPSAAALRAALEKLSR